MVPVRIINDGVDEENEQLLSRLTLTAHGQAEARAAARKVCDPTPMMGEDWNQVARGRDG